MKRVFFLMVSSLLCVFITSCAQNVSPNIYDASELGVASKVVPGVIIAKRPVSIDANSGAGGLAGVGAGAAAGSAIGGSPAANLVAAVGGAVIGGLAGNAIDQAVNHHQGFEYIIKLNKGSIVSVAQTQDVQFAIHQHILVIYGAMTRIIADNRATRN